MKRIIIGLALAVLASPTLAKKLCWRVPGTYVWEWPSGVTQIVHGQLWGGGGAGGGSNCPNGIHGGAGASTSYVPFGRAVTISRPPSGQSKIIVGAGAPSTCANCMQSGADGGQTSFWIDATSMDAQHGTDPDVFSVGGGGGQAGTCGAGGDGGAGGEYGGTHNGRYLDPDFVAGGQGQASSPTIDRPMGAAAPRGGGGGNNQQDGTQPGGGGAPANNQLAGGKGGDGMACLEY